MRTTDPTKIWGWTQALAKGNQFLPIGSRPPFCSYGQYVLDTTMRIQTQKNTSPHIRYILTSIIWKSFHIKLIDGDNIAYLRRCMSVLKIENLWNVQNTMYFKLELSDLGFKMLSMKINYTYIFRTCGIGIRRLYINISQLRWCHCVIQVAQCYSRKMLPCINPVCDIGTKVVSIKISYLPIFHYMVYFCVLFCISLFSCCPFSFGNFFFCLCLNYDFFFNTPWYLQIFRKMWNNAYVICGYIIYIFFPSIYLRPFIEIKWEMQHLVVQSEQKYWEGKVIYMFH